MENTRAHSHKSYRVKSKFPVILTKKSNTGHLLEKVILKDHSSTHSSTPEPSLTVQLKKIHRRPGNSSSPIPKPDTFNDQTNEALSNLIKNNAITFMSPHEFINQIHNDSMTQSPSSKFKLDNSSPVLANKLNKNQEQIEWSHYEPFCDFRVSTSSTPYRNDKPSKPSKIIEVTGFQIPKLIRNNYTKRPEAASASAKSQDLHWSKVLSTRKSYKPVIIYNKQHKYFRPKAEELLRVTSNCYYHM